MPDTTATPPQDAGSGTQQPQTPSAGTQTTPPAGSEPQPTPGTSVDPAELQQRYLEAVAKHEAQTFQLSQQKKQLEQQLAEYQQRLDAWKSNPTQALQDLGIDPGVVVDTILNSDGAPKVENEVQTLKDQISQLQSRLDERMKTEEQREQEAKQRAFFQEVGGKVRELAESSPDMQELKLALAIERDLFGREPDLAALVQQPYTEAQQTFGRGLTPEEIAGKLKTRAAELVERIRKSETIRQILGSQPQQQTPTGTAAIDGVGTNSAQPKNPAEMTTKEWIEYVKQRAVRQQ